LATNRNSHEEMEVLPKGIGLARKNFFKIQFVEPRRDKGFTKR
jgi:hypothetical protein